MEGNVPANSSAWIHTENLSITLQVSMSVCAGKVKNSLEKCNLSVSHTIACKEVPGHEDANINTPKCSIEEKWVQLRENKIVWWEYTYMLSDSTIILQKRF